MIVVRDIFQLHFGKAREGLELLRQARDMVATAGGRPTRTLTDVTGTYYTLVWESEYESLGEYEARLSSDLGRAEWKEWYSRFSPLLREGRREIFRSVG